MKLYKSKRHFFFFFLSINNIIVFKKRGIQQRPKKQSKKERKSKLTSAKRRLKKKKKIHLITEGSKPGYTLAHDESELKKDFSLSKEKTTSLKQFFSLFPNFSKQARRGSPPNSGFLFA